MKATPLLILGAAGLAAWAIASPPAVGGGSGGSGGAGGQPTGVYVTNPSDVIIDPSGWYTLSSGAQITKLPPIDSSTGGFARIGPANWLQVAASMNARLPTLAEYDLLHAEGVHISPSTLPTQQMLIAAFPGINLSDPKAVQAAAQQMLNTSMSSSTWDKLHDDTVRSKLTAIGWDGTKPVDNAGKHWAQPDAQTPAGNGLLYGWWNAAYPSTSMIQTPYRLHGGDQIDYGSMPHLVML